MGGKISEVWGQEWAASICYTAPPPAQKHRNPAPLEPKTLPLLPAWTYLGAPFRVYGVEKKNMGGRTCFYREGWEFSGTVGAV